MLQRVAAYLPVFIADNAAITKRKSPVSYSVLQCLTVCCSVLQCVAACCLVLHASCCSVLLCVAVNHNMLQCVAACSAYLPMFTADHTEKVRAKPSARTRLASVRWHLYNTHAKKKGLKKKIASKKTDSIKKIKCQRKKEQTKEGTLRT